MNSAEAFEQFRCPVCLEIPPEEVLQCKSGHTVCSQCHRKLDECPECRIPYGSDKIRNRQIEFVLDKMKFPCPNKDEGCDEILERKSIPEHFKSCKFTVKSLKLCKMIGYNCPYAFKSNEVDSFETHLETDHEALIHRGHGVQLTQENFQQLSSNKIWTPIVFHTVFPDSSKVMRLKRFLLLSWLDAGNRTLTWTCLLLDDPDEDYDDLVEFTISPVKVTGKDLEWSQQCVMYLDAEKTLAARPFQVPLAHLVGDYMTEGRLTMKVSLQKRLSSAKEQAKELATLVTVCSLAEGDLESGKAPIGVILGEGQDQDIIFHGASCIQCSKKDLEGLLFFCLQCANQPFCKECFSPATHAQHVFALVRSLEQMVILQKLTKNWKDSVLPHGELENELHGWVKQNKSAVFENIKCDSCERSPIVGTRFKCLQCKNFDLCMYCAPSGLHSHHIFGVITNHFQNEFITCVASRTALIK